MIQKPPENWDRTPICNTTLAWLHGSDSLRSKLNPGQQIVKVPLLNYWRLNCSPSQIPANSKVEMHADTILLCTARSSASPNVFCDISEARATAPRESTKGRWSQIWRLDCTKYEYCIHLGTSYIVEFEVEFLCNVKLWLKKSMQDMFQ